MTNNSQTPQFTLTYTNSQPASTSSALIEILDPNDNLIWASAGTPVTGSFSHIFPQTTFPRLFYGFPYNFRVRLNTACGLTPWSNGIQVTPIPLATEPDSTVIAIDLQVVTINVAGNIATVEIDNDTAPTSTVDCTGGQYFAIISSNNPAEGSNYDPNLSDRSEVTGLTFTTPPDTCTLGFQMPFPVAIGQQYWIRIGNSDDTIGGTGTVSNPVLATVVA